MYQNIGLISYFRALWDPLPGNLLMTTLLVLVVAWEFVGICYMPCNTQYSLSEEHRIALKNKQSIMYEQVD